MQSEITLRPLEASDWALFRECRLRALKAAPGMFATSYQEGLGHPEAYWRDAVTGDNKHQVFGLFDRSKPVGITAVFTYRGDPIGETAILAMSFIEPQYRGQGLSRLLYEARLDWVRAQSQFKRAESRMKHPDVPTKPSAFGTLAENHAHGPMEWWRTR